MGDWRDECLTDPFDMSEMTSTSLGPRVGLGRGADAKYDKVWFLLTVFRAQARSQPALMLGEF